MTTSYETSLRMKELGFPQKGGEYYWVERKGFRWNLELNKGEDYFEFIVKHKSGLVDHFYNYKPLCRAFTLGELVRMMGDDSNRFMCVENNKWTAAFLFPYEFFDTPEEAAAELAIELVGSGVIKFETNQKEV